MKFRAFHRELNEEVSRDEIFRSLDPHNNHAAAAAFLPQEKRYSARRLRVDALLP
jgi:hypothetical protein